MSRWHLVPCAWTVEDDSVVAVSLEAPLRNPVRLTGSAAACWVALAESTDGTSAGELARAVLGGEGAVGPPGEIVRGIERFLDDLVNAGLVVSRPNN